MRLAVLTLVAAAAMGQAPKDDTIVLPTAASDIARGKTLYLGSCTYCHGPTGDGGKGANLALPELARAKTDGDLVRLIEVGVPGTEMPGAYHMTRREVTQTAAFVRTLGKVNVRPVTGDVVRGKAVYGKNGCWGCHTTRENGLYTGGYAGPDLSSIGSKRSVAHVAESIAKPEASVDESYLLTRIQTRNGQAVTGRTLSETTFHIVVRDGGGQNRVIPKTEVASISRDRGQSTMPSYQSKLSAGELEDLVAYLVSLKEVQ